MDGVYWRSPSGAEHETWCCAVFGFRRCTPCVSTLHRILTGLDVGAFETALRTWIEPQLEAPITLEPVAIDGKAVRGAKDQHLPSAHLLSAFASRRGAVLAQLAIGERENELTQALPLLQQIDLPSPQAVDGVFAETYAGQRAQQGSDISMPASYGRESGRPDQR